ncbi:MAG: nucleotidyltransferase domain-containing protein, partial [Oscillatoriales cyanobacterium]
MTNPNLPQNFNLIVPAGTQIVTKIEVKNPGGDQSWKQGAVGVIVKSPTD